MSKGKEISDELRKSVRNAGASIPQLAELAGYFCAVVGGPKAFANLLFQEFAEAPSGSIIRQRILDMILRTIQNANQAMPLITEVQNMEEDDLEREMALVLEKVNSGSESGRTTEASPEKELPKEASVGVVATQHPEGNREIAIGPPKIKPSRRNAKSNKGTPRGDAGEVPTAGDPAGGSEGQA